MSMPPARTTKSVMMTSPKSHRCEVLSVAAMLSQRAIISLEFRMRWWSSHHSHLCLFLGALCDIWLQMATKLSVAG